MVKIQNLVIGGGSIYGISFFGFLKHTNLKNVWKIDDINTIYGVSVGTMIGTMVCLKMDWDTLEDYMINRPWENVFTVDIPHVLNCIDNCGFFTIAQVLDFFVPLFDAKDISHDITLAQFYEYSGIEQHFIASKISNKTLALELVDISYKTHPEWKLIDAMYVSCSLPLLFKPLIVDNEVYLDGIFSHNDISEVCPFEPDTILCITTKSFETAPLKDTSSLFEYLGYFFFSIIRRGIPTTPVGDHKNFYSIEANTANLGILKHIYLIIKNADERRKLLDLGINAFNKHTPQEK